MRILRGFKTQFIEFIVTSPKKTLGLFFLLTGILAIGLGQLKTDFSYKVWYNEADPLMDLYERFESNFGNDDSVIIGLQSKEGIFSEDSVQLIQKVTDELYQVSDIIRVDSILNFHDIKANGDEIDIQPILSKEDLQNLTPDKLKAAKNKALANDILVGSFINKNAQFTLIDAQVRPAARDTAPDYTQITQEIYALLDKFKKENPKVKLVATGPVILTDTFRSVTLDDMAFLIPILYGVFTLVLIYLFRSVSGVLLPYVTITFSTVMTLGTMGLLGLSLNTLTSATPTILLTVALADAIHILTVFYLGKKSGFAHRDALRLTLGKNFYPTLLTTITTALGFLSFFDAKIKPVSELGIAVGIGAVYAWICAYALLGPLLALLPAKGEAEETKLLEKDIPAGEGSLRYADFIAKHAKGVLVASLALGAIGIFFSKDLVVDMDPVKQFPKSHPVVNAYNTIEDQMGFIGQIEVMVSSKNPEGAKEPVFLEKVEELENWLSSQTYVTSVLSINDYLKIINQAFHNGEKEYYKIPPTSQHVAQELFFYSMGLPPEKPIENRINAQRDAIRLSVNWKLSASGESNEKFALINKKAKELGLDAKVTGKVPLFHELTPYVVETFATSLSIALVTITLALSLIMQSFKLGLFAMIPSVLPLMIGGGAFALSGNHIDMGTVLVASVCLGISVDDSVHFMFAYKRMIREKTFRNTLGSIATNIFPSLFNTTLLLVLGFSSFIFGTYVPNAKFGVSVALILVVALICDFVVLPSLLAVFGEKKPLKRAA